MSRSLVVTALLAAALGSSTTAWLATTEPSSPDPIVLHEGAAGPRAVTSSPRPRLDLRPRIEQEQQRELPPLRDRDDVDAYLERLVSRARVQGRVTAVEVEPGMSAIFALRGSMPEAQLLALADDFDARMQALSAELGASPRSSAPDFDEALFALHDARDPVARGEAIERVLEALEPLDEPARLEAEARLDQTLGGPEPELRADTAALRDDIEAATEPHDREHAVRRYVEAVENLPREQAEALLDEVERGEVPGVSLR